MTKKARSEADVCGGLERGPGERGTVARSTTVGPYAGPGGSVDVGYSAADIYPVDIGQKATRGPAATRVPLDQLAPLYGGAGPQEDVPGNVSPRVNRGDRSYRNPRGR